MSERSYLNATLKMEGVLNRDIHRAPMSMDKMDPEIVGEIPTLWIYHLYQNLIGPWTERSFYLSLLPRWLVELIVYFWQRNSSWDHWDICRVVCDFCQKYAFECAQHVYGIKVCVDWGNHIDHSGADRNKPKSLQNLKIRKEKIFQ